MSQQLTAEDKLALVAHVYDKFYSGTSTFEGIGEDIAYLQGAIVKGTKCQWDAGSQIFEVMQREFPLDHPVWQFVEIEEDETEAVPDPVGPGTGRLGPDEMGFLLDAQQRYAVVFEDANTNPNGTSYVRVIDRVRNNEDAYWNSDEWSESEDQAVEVMGAIFGWVMGHTDRPFYFN